MAIVPVSKVTLYGIGSQKEAVLDGLQGLGCTHLVNLTPGEARGRPSRGYSVEAHEALEYLASCPAKRRSAKTAADFDFAAVEQEALEIRGRERELKDESDFVLKAIEAVQPWGDFELPGEQEQGGLRFWFYVVPHRRMEAIRESGLVWQAVARDERFDYVVVIHPEQPQNMPVAPENLDPRSLSRLTARLHEIEIELDRLYWRRVELTRWCSLLRRAMAEADDRALLEHASRQTRDDSGVFAVQGWAPRDAVSRIEKFARKRGLALSLEEPRPEDNPPTLLSNPEPLAGGETTVTFYMTPGYHTWDPSIVVFFSFAAFFAMILSDAGYAMLLGVILMLAWRKLGHTRSNVRLRNLFLTLVLASFAYGVMVGGYFGVSPAGGVLASLHVLNARDHNGMMFLTIIVGAFHIMLANLVTAWRYWGSAHAFAPVGWATMVLGGLIAGFRIGHKEPLGPVEIAFLAGGAGAVLLFSSQRALSFRRIGDLVRRLLDGLKGLCDVSKAFGDVLSYLRLFALGLASTVLASTFNDIAVTTARYRGVGLLAAILILVVGHGLNFVLAVIGGVVHGLRLNCIEFFNWSLPEEGYPFQAFCKKASQ